MTSKTPIRLRADAHLDVVSGADGLVDCRRLFIGDHQRALVRTFAEAVTLLGQSRRNPAALKSLEDSADVNKFYEVSLDPGAPSVTLRDEFFRQPGPQFELDLQLEIQCGGRHIRRPFPLEQLGGLGLLLPLLRGRFADDEIRSTLADAGGSREAHAGELLDWFGTSDLIENSPLNRDAFPRPTDGTRLSFVGHTSLLVQTHSTAVAFDPLFRLDYGHFSRARGVADLALSAICLSHSHWDHCHFQTLAWFDKTVPVLIPRVVRPTAFNPPIVSMLQALGFEDIREVEHWSAVSFGDMEIIPTPFHGEQDEPGAVIDHYTYVVRSPSSTLYGGVDCFEDTFGKMPPVLERIRNEYQPDVAALPVSKMVFYFRAGGVNSFCRELSAEMLDESYQYTAGPKEAAAWAKTLGVKYVFGYATFVFGRWVVPPVLHQFRLALRALGIESALLPLRPFDSLDLPTQSGSLAVRRRVLLGWLRIADFSQRADQRLTGFALYRGIRRLVRRLLPTTSGHHH